MPPYGSFQNRNVWPPIRGKHRVYLAGFCTFLKWSPSVFLITGVSGGLCLSLSGLIAEKQMQLLACFSKKSHSLCTINHPIAHLGNKSCAKSFSPRLLAEVHVQLLSRCPISAEMLRFNPRSQSIMLIAAARIHHTYPCGPVVHATVNNRCLAKRRRKGLEVLQRCSAPRSLIPKQCGFHGPGCDSAAREDDVRKIFAEETSLFSLFLRLFQFLA